MCVYMYTHIYNLIYIYIFFPFAIFSYVGKCCSTGLGGGYMGIYILPTVLKVS